MRNAIYASIHHAVSTDDRPQHEKCPKGESSWCFYQAAKAKNEVPGPHKKKIKRAPLNELCFQKILPLYERLTDDSLLNRCARCLTQNANESLHSVIWNKCSKEIFVSRPRVKIAASLGVCEYNLGVKRTVTEFMGHLGLTLTEKSLEIAKSLDAEKLVQGIKRSTQKSKDARRIVKQAQRQQEKNIVESEGPSYEAGSF